MFCRFIQNNLSAYIDGEVSMIKKYFIEKHLIGCADCKKKLEFIGAVVSLTDKKEEYKLSDDFMENLKAKITSSKVTEQKQIKLVPVFGLKVALVTISVVFMVFGSYFLFKPAYKLDTSNLGYPEATLAYQTKGNDNYSDNVIELANFENQTRRW